MASKSQSFEASGHGIQAEDFSLLLGGPLYQLYLRTRLVRPALDLVLRRIVCLSAISWLPPLFLAIIAGHLLGGVDVPFLHDAEVPTRLVALVLLIAAEVTVHRRIQVIVEEFPERGIITEEDRPRFQRLLASLIRVRNSFVVEIILLLIAFTVGHWIWTKKVTLGVSTWYGVSVGGETHLSPAGYWYAFVSLPILRFLILRWYFRIFVWYGFLWRVRALPLHLNLLHPDRAGGLGFLEGSVFAFAPVLMAQTILLAGVIGERIWHTGAVLPAFKMEIVCVTLFLMLIVLAPLGFFAGQLTRTRRTARREFGNLASHYVDAFRRKWILTGNQESQPMLGTPDLQSLADLANSFDVVHEMRSFPFAKETLLRLAVILLLPLAPLLLTLISFEHMIDRLIQVLL